MASNSSLSPVDKIIRKNMFWAMGAGAIPIPFADIAAVTVIQLDMLKELCKHHGVEYREQSGKSIVTTLSSSLTSRYIASSFKFIPVIGQAIGTGAMMALSGAFTYAIGKVFDKYLSRDGSLDLLDPDEAKVFFKEAFEKGKSVAKAIRKELKGKKEEVVEV